jgi:hypothetical protein
VLSARGVRHSLLSMHGDHDTPYWSTAFEHTLRILEPLLARPQPEAD